MKAMILAAGLGERLMPLTEQRPKPLFPVVNLPVIRYNLEFLKHHGITDIVINLYHLPRMIEQELGDGSVMGVRITYSYEEELWGTGGGLKLVEPFFADEECFVVMNADILLDCDLEDAIHFHRRHGATATMVLTQHAPIQVYGAVEVDENFAIRNIAGRLEDVRESERTPAVFTGVHILSPRIFEYIPPNINSCINAYAYPKMIRNGEKVLGYLMEGFWSDLGRPETYFAANMSYLDRKISLRHYDPLAHFTLKPAKERSELACLGENVELGSEIEFKPPFIVGHNVKIGDKAHIGPYAIVGDNCQLGKHSQVSEAIVFSGCKVGNRSKVIGMVLGKKHKLRVSSSATKTQVLKAVEE